MISPTNRAIGRVFLVGCPRSGTTLLQSLLGSHPEIISFPETNLFSSLCSKSRFKRKLKLASPQARKNFEQFLNIVDSPEMSRYLPRHPLFISQYAKTFVTVFDQLTYQNNKSIWLEKTPSHLRWINLIEQLVPSVKFIHIIRNGSDVVASLYDVTRKHKDFAGTTAWSIDKCVAWWLKDIEVSSKNRHKSNHYLIR